jgi:HEAT repeat protein
MMKKPGKFRVAIVVVASTVVLTSALKSPAVAAPAAANRTTSSATNSAVKVTTKSATKAKANVSAKAAANVGSKDAAKASASGNSSKTDQAKAIISDLQTMDHPEQKIRSSTPGWQEERQAATESSQRRIHEAQTKLSSLGSSIAPVLAEGLNSSSHDVSDTCAKVLAQFGEDSVSSVIATIKKYGVIPNAVSTLKEIGSDSLPPLVLMLKSPDKTESMTALAVMDSMLNVQGGFHAYRSYIVSTRFANANSPSVVFSGPQIEQICNIQTNDASVKFKQAYADLLGKIGPRSPHVATRLATFISKEEQPEVRQSAINALGSIVGNQNQDVANEYVDILLKCLATDDYAGCRVEAACALGRIPASASKSVPALARSLKDGYPEVVTASLQALGTLGEKASGALPDLLKFVQDASEPAAQSYSMTAIGNMKGAALPALPFVLKCLTGDNPQLRSGAVNVIANLGPAASSAVPALIPMLSDPQLRFNAIRALGAIGPAASAAVPALKELAQPDHIEPYNVRQVQQALQKITGEAQGSLAVPQGNVMPSIVPIAPPSSVPPHSPNSSSI